MGRRGSGGRERTLVLCRRGGQREDLQQRNLRHSAPLQLEASTYDQHSAFL